MEAVFVLRREGAAIVTVGHAVHVVVVVGAAVVVLEAVAILWQLGAVVGVIRDAIAVRVVIARGVAKAEYGSERRGADRVIYREFDAGEQPEIAAQGFACAQPEQHR